jgi:hypothetical protein
MKKKNKNRHLTQEQRKNYVPKVRGVQVFSGNVASAIPFNDIKKLDNEKLQENYIDKASDISVIPFNQVFTVLPVDNGKGVLVEKNPILPTPPTPLNTEAIPVISPTPKSEAQKYSEIKTVVEFTQPTQEIKSFFNIKEIVTK